MSDPPVQLDELLHGETEDDPSDETLNLAVYPDSPPKSGMWVDVDEVIANVTEEEMEAGRLMGESIDTEDDEDVGY